jgi:SAM-dependent methyltransferase
VREILGSLPPGARVLDLGSATGSFDAAAYPCRVVRVDAEQFLPAPAGFVQADAAALPFRSGAFDAAICNHGLEHFVRLDAAIAEIGRVVKPEGAFFIAVPDASTFTDILYRWLARGGGHVNPFTSAERLAAHIEHLTGFPHAGTRLLHSSLSFLNRRNRKAPPPRKLLLLGGGREWTLVLANALLRFSDRVLGTRASVYGWALYFGRVGEKVETRACSNVCARCGSGHAAEWLETSGYATRWFYHCPQCGARNVFTRDSAS